MMIGHDRRALHGRASGALSRRANKGQRANSDESGEQQVVSAGNKCATDTLRALASHSTISGPSRELRNAERLMMSTGDTGRPNKRLPIRQMPVAKLARAEQRSSTIMSHLMILTITQLLPLLALALALGLHSGSAQVAPSAPVAAPDEAASAVKGEQLRAAESSDKYTPPILETSSSPSSAPEVPAVSGLDPSPVQSQAALSGPIQEATADADQQLIAAVSAAESARLGSGAGSGADQQTSDNDVPVESTARQVARKSDTQEVQKQAPVKGRSIKRIFGGHLGVFGRKRTAQDGLEEQVSETSPPKATKSNHYYYTSSPRPPTTRRVSKTLAEVADYREIVVQPENGNEPIEQQHVSSDGDSQAEQHEASVQQQTEPPSTATESTQSSQIAADAGQEDPPTPYIRLSNIATINSSSSATPGNASAGESGMKLMRIYVIDLDQKLVVGSAGSLVQQASTPASVEYRLTDEAAGAEPLQSAPSSAAVTQAPASGGASRRDNPTGYVLLDREALTGNLSQVAVQLGERGAGPHPGGLRAANYSASGAHEIVIGAGPSYGEQQVKDGPSAQMSAIKPAAVAPEPAVTAGQQQVIYQSVPQYIAPQYNSNGNANASNIARPAEPQQQQQQAQQQEWQQEQQAYNQVQQQHQQVNPDGRQPQQRATYAGNYTSKQTGFVQAPSEYLQLDKQQADSGHLSVYRQEAAMYQQAASGEPGQQQYEREQLNKPGQVSAHYRQPAGDHWRPVDLAAPASPAHAGQSIRPAQGHAGRPEPINGYKSDHDVVSLARQQVNYAHAGAAFPLSDTNHAPANYQLQSKANETSYTNSIYFQDVTAPGQQQQVPIHHPSGQTGSYNGSQARPANPDEPVSPEGVTNEYPARRQPVRAAGAKQEPASLEAPKIPRAHSSAYRLAPAGGQRASAYPAVAGPPVADGVYQEEEPGAGEEQPASMAESYGARHPVRVRQGRPRAKANQARPPVSESELAYAAAAASYEPAAEYPGRGAARPHHWSASGPAPPSRGILSWDSISSAARRLPASLSSIFGASGAQSRPPSHYPTMGQGKSAHYDRDVSAFHRPYPLRHSASQAPAADGYASDYLDGADLSSASSPPLDAGKQQPRGLNASNEQAVVLDLADISGFEGGPAKQRPRPPRPGKRRPGRKPEAAYALEAADADKLEPAHMAVLSSIEEQLAGGVRTRGRRPKRPAQSSAAYSEQEHAPAETLEHELGGAPEAAQEHAERGARPSSLQIGQYRITPQTQFVQSIIEPSRQMLGQYLKQYIGQLGQLAGRLN